MRVSALARDRAAHRPHALHGEARLWPETNCYVDLWIELVHALGHDPHALLGCALSSGFEGDQWLFFKPAAGDLYAMYGIDLQELTVWRDLCDHVPTQLARGHLVLVEVDAFHLPDTRGTSYGTKHSKTTIAIESIDLAARSLGYFHNAGWYALEGADFDALLAPGHPLSGGLPPYSELVRLCASEPLPTAQLVALARARLAGHLARAPRDNPFTQYRARFADDLAWLTEQPAETFHEYAFANVRQFGAAFELAGSFLGWLAEHGERAAETARARCAQIAEHAKTLQFKAARAVMRKRPVDVAGEFDALEAAWAEAYDSLRSTYA